MLIVSVPEEHTLSSLSPYKLLAVSQSLSLVLVLLLLSLLLDLLLLLLLLLSLLVVIMQLLGLSGMGDSIGIKHLDRPRVMLLALRT